VKTARIGILLVGPVLIVGSLYWLVYGGGDVDGESSPASSPPARGTVGPLTPRQQRILNRACREQAEALRAQLGANGRVFVHPPYVLAGDDRPEQLKQLYERVVKPISRALHTSYFDRRPTEPVTILAFSNESAFREYSQQLTVQRRACYSGYYLRGKRQIVVNMATGEGTLAHELTHALSHFDAPDLPEWFDEGLASLHEECEFSADGLRLLGRSNWRLQYLKQPLEDGTLPEMSALMMQREFRGSYEAVAYAHARYFCLYLQHRGLLAHYYRKLKLTVNDDPTGITALKQTLHVDSLDEFDRDFQRWLNKTANGSAARQ